MTTTAELQAALEYATCAETPADARGADGPRLNFDANDAGRDLVRLVLTLVEFLRKLLERQAIARMDAGALTDEEIERVGVALMRIEETIGALMEEFGLEDAPLNLDLGPLGTLM